MELRIKRWLISNRRGSVAIKDLEDRLVAVDKKLDKEGWLDSLRQDRQKIISELWTALRVEEHSWKQKSRVRWLVDSDRNTKKFHSVANGRQRTNFLGDLSFNASGLRINFYKSCVVKVSKRIRDREVNWAVAFRCVEASLPITYLGLPLGGRRCSKIFWKELVSRLENRLAPWKRIFLNKGGRLILIKSMMSSIPTYYMSNFQIPVGVAQKIESLQSGFLWGDGCEKRKVHPIKWATNKSLLAKSVWRFGNEDSTLWEMVICAKYGIPMKSYAGTGNVQLQLPFFFVKAVNRLFEVGMDSAQILGEGLHVVVGSGDRASFWNDLKVDSTPLKVVFPRIFVLAVKKTGPVQDFGRWTGSNWEWEVPLRRQLFDWEIQQWKSFQDCLDCIKIQGTIFD
ncbi:hypothetical protein Dsin_013495 [Dipteronia sinensis]|uniref:Uncharacterized protein n=1 Tax=Dipteronia sinensis TaxID=43782 RepID=A0AAE0AKY2_9ROSI|nr:hypothetical protein Dsin_013495 [Dipteronia sinensis]